MILASRQLLKEVSGRKRPSTVSAWLRLQRIEFLPGADGWPRVLVSEIERRMSSGEYSRPEPKLNIAAMAALGRRA